MEYRCMVIRETIKTPINSIITITLIKFSELQCTKLLIEILGYKFDKKLNILNIQIRNGQ